MQRHPWRVTRVVRPAMIVAIAALLAGIPGCETLDPAGGRKPGAGTGRTTLLIAAPQGDEWKELTTDAGTFFVKAVDGMADVVVIYAVTLTPGVQTLDQFDAVLEALRDPRYANRRKREFFGVPTLFFDSSRQDTGEGFEVIRKALGLRPRPSGYKYATREKGVFLLHPGRPGSVVRVGCARTSYHGLLGTHFEQEAEFFLQQFIADNCLDPASVAPVPAPATFE